MKHARASRGRAQFKQLAVRLSPEDWRKFHELEDHYGLAQVDFVSRMISELHSLAGLGGDSLSALRNLGTFLREASRRLK